jgi:predicted nuclease with TOPRIM domain
MEHEQLIERVNRHEVEIQDLKTRLDYQLTETRRTNKNLNRLCNELEKDREETRALIYGVDDDNPGLVRKMDRIEGYYQRQKKAWWAMMTAAIGSGVAWVFNLVQGK